MASDIPSYFNIYQLTGYEALLLQGFPKEYADRVKGEVSDRPGHEILDVHMDFSVTFWDREGCLSSNRLLMEFDRDDLEKLLCYLNLVTKAVSKDDDTVKKAIAEGYIYG